MNLPQLLTSIYEYLETIPDLPTIFYPNINQKDIPDERIAVFVLPARPDDIGTKIVKMNTGIIQVNVYTKPNRGEIKTAEIVQKVLDAFPRGTVIPTSLIRIDKTPYPSTGMNDDNGDYMIPVTIEYNRVTV